MAGLIPQSFIDDLLDRADIVEVIDRRVRLKKVDAITWRAVHSMKKNHLRSASARKNSSTTALVVVRVATLSDS